MQATRGPCGAHIFSVLRKGFGCRVSGKTMIRYYAATQKGSGRRENEDRVLVGDFVLKAGSYSGTADSAFVSLVCDGVGSVPGGAEAAQILAETFLMYKGSGFSDFSVRTASLAANEEIRDMQRAKPGKRRMRTTATGLCIQNGKTMIFCVGDSRVYRISNGALSLLTEDDTLAWELYRNGRVSDPQKAPSLLRRTVTRYFGGQHSLCIPSFYYDSVPDGGCLYMLCSDGVWGKIKEAELRAALCAETDLPEKCQAVMKLALHNGSADDMSLVLISCGPTLKSPVSSEMTGG